MTTVLRFVTRTPPIPVIVDTVETRRPETSPKVTTVLRFATRTPPIPVIVDTFETRRPEASPKVTTVLRFATRMPPIPVIVDTFVMRNVKSDDSSALRDDFRLRQVRRKSDTSPTLRGRLRTLASTNATTSRRLLDPWTPTLKREPFCYAFGKNWETTKTGKRHDNNISGQGKRNRVFFFKPIRPCLVMCCVGCVGSHLIVWIIMGYLLPPFFCFSAHQNPIFLCLLQSEANLDHVLQP